MAGVLFNPGPALSRLACKSGRALAALCWVPILLSFPAAFCLGILSLCNGEGTCSSSSCLSGRGGKKGSGMCLRFEAIQTSELSAERGSVSELRDHIDMMSNAELQRATITCLVSDGDVQAAVDRTRCYRGQRTAGAPTAVCKPGAGLCWDAKAVVQSFLIRRG